MPLPQVKTPKSLPVLCIGKDGASQLSVKWSDNHALRWIVGFNPRTRVGCDQPLENLSIYYQESARRRLVRDEPEYDRVTNYESSNDAFVVENYEAGCLIENIQLVI